METQQFASEFHNASLVVLSTTINRHQPPSTIVYHKLSGSGSGTTERTTRYTTETTTYRTTTTTDSTPNKDICKDPSFDAVIIEKGWVRAFKG